MTSLKSVFFSVLVFLFCYFFFFFSFFFLFFFFCLFSSFILTFFFLSFQERNDELQKRDFINARQEKTLVALHSNAFIANQEQLKGYILTKVWMCLMALFELLLLLWLLLLLLLL